MSRYQLESMREKRGTYRRHRNLFREWELLKKKTLLMDCFVYEKNVERREVDMIYIPVLGIVSLSLSFARYSISIPPL